MKSRARAASLGAPTLVLACAVAATAHAQTDEHKRAVRAFIAARADIDAGNCRAAIPKLEESLAYEPSVGAHLSMADCYEQMDLLAAWRELKEAANLAASKNDDRAAVALARASALEPRLATLRVSVPGGVADLALRLDGSVVKPFVFRGGLVATTPGAHDIDVTAPGKAPWHARVVVPAAGAPVAVDVALDDEPRSVTPVTPPSPVTAPPASAQPLAVETKPPQHEPGPEAGASGGAQRTIGVVTLAVGGAGLALGAVYGFVALGKNAQLRDACGGDVHRCTATAGASNVVDARDGAQTAATISTVSLIAGGALVAAGVVVFVTAPSHGASSAIAVAPWVDRDVRGLTIGGRFE